MFIADRDFEEADNVILVARSFYGVFTDLTTLGLHRTGLDIILRRNEGMSGELFSGKRIDSNTGRVVDIHILICPDSTKLIERLRLAINGLVNPGEKCTVRIRSDYFEEANLEEAVAVECTNLGHDICLH